jgi:hypothetical protein
VRAVGRFIAFDFLTCYKSSIEFAGLSHEL